MRHPVVVSLVVWIGLAASARGDEALAPADGVAKTQRQIMLKVKILEVSVSDMRQRLGIDLSQVFNSQKQLEAGSEIGLLIFLSRNHVATVRGENEIAAADGRPAEFASGTTATGANLGTDVRLVPTLLDGGRIRIALQARERHVDESKRAARGSNAGKVETSDIDRQFELDLGRTVLCADRCAAASPWSPIRRQAVAPAGTWKRSSCTSSPPSLLPILRSDSPPAYPWANCRQYSYSAMAVAVATLKL